MADSGHGSAQNSRTDSDRPSIPAGVPVLPPVPFSAVPNVSPPLPPPGMPAQGGPGQRPAIDESSSKSVQPIAPSVPFSRGQRSPAGPQGLSAVPHTFIPAIPPSPSASVVSSSASIPPSRQASIPPSAPTSMPPFQSLSGGAIRSMVPVAKPAVTVPAGVPVGTASRPLGRAQPFYCAVTAEVSHEARASDEPSAEVEHRNRLWWLVGPWLEKMVRATPPWLVSLVFHIVLLLLLALIGVPQINRSPLTITLGDSDYSGQQLDVFEAFSLGDSQQLDPDMALADVPAADPLASPPQLDPQALAGISTTSELEAPVIGSLLRGRQIGSKQALLAAYGGTARTEEAVRLALEWLKRQQQSDGSWRLDGPYPDGASDENRVAATAMALLAFQGAGYTHQGGEFQTVVQRGMTALLKMQDRDGNFFHRGPQHHRLYSQAMATIAVCELYGMTQDAKLLHPAELALQYCINAQAPEGGWRYQPRVDSDTSVTGWFAMALQSGRMAGLTVPSFVLDNISKYLDSAQVDDGSRYAYQPGGGPRLSMTAEALLCRQYLGWSRDDPRMRRGASELLANPISWERPNVYYWYYATQVLHHLGGQEWFTWNNVMRERLPEQQIRSGPQTGSWAPTADAFDRQGGRLYVTCLCTFMLEVYYRHLPIYRHY